MPWPYLHVLWQGANALERRVQLPGALLFGPRNAHGGLQQVRSTNVAHEHEVAREDPHRLVRGRRITKQEREVLRRVSGGVHRADADLADLNHVAVAQERRAGLLRECVLPLGRACAGEHQPGASFLGEVAGARHEVRVDMGLSHRDDPQVEALREPDVLVRVAIRIKDERIPVAGANQVTGLGERVVIDAPQYHGPSLPVVCNNAPRTGIWRASSALCAVL